MELGTRNVERRTGDVRSGARGAEHRVLHAHQPADADPTSLLTPHPSLLTPHSPPRH